MNVPEDGLLSSPADFRSADLDRIYGRGYFHGEGSGYPAEGYIHAHPNWEDWLDVIQLLKPDGLFLDLGCAYGYLVEAARRRGFEAFGMDISSFALSQEERLRPFLLRADLTRIPVRGERADVVTVFDVLEHIMPAPALLDECMRLLKPEGLLIGATPDPITFDRPEATHFFERPPSFWLRHLAERGLDVSFRFSVDPYNFQFIAARRGSSTASRLGIFQHDYFHDTPDFVDASKSVRAVPRFGWRALESGARELAGRRAALYLCNPDSSPQEVRARLRIETSPDFSRLRIRLDSWVLREVSLTSEATVHTVELGPFLLPEGGHHLFFDLDPGGPTVRVSGIEIEASPATSRQLVESLPFDLFQRYQLVADVSEILHPETILDIGGVLGDQEGHLATSADFLSRGPQGARVISTDLRQCDLPTHQPATAARQPFGDEAFDLVVSLDVLEHLERSMRPEFLAEMLRLARHWVLLTAPTDSPEVIESEESLSSHLMSGQSFLQEHRSLGLPKADETTTFFRNLGCHVETLPNGYLPNWMIAQTLSQLLFAYGDASLVQSWNRLYNTSCYKSDLRGPAYRTVWVVSKGPFSKDVLSRIRELPVFEPSPVQDHLQNLLTSREFLEILGRVATRVRTEERSQQDLQFLLNERQKLAAILEEELRNQKNMPLWKVLLRRVRDRLK